MINQYKYDILKYPFERLIQEIYREKYDFNDDLQNLHKILDNLSIDEKKDLLTIPILGINDRKSRFIKDYYQFVDRDSTFNDCYKTFIREIVKPIFPDEQQILYQTTPNLRISFPGTTAIGQRESDPSPEIIGLHSDSEFGHSEREINFIIPITEMFGTNSIYYEKTPGSTTEISNFENLILQKDEFFKCFFNQQRHYNRVNDTGKTRISLDLRVIPYSKYMKTEMTSISDHKKLELGDYFSII